MQRSACVSSFLIDNVTVDADAEAAKNGGKRSPKSTLR
jgi:hypothetical protein